MIELTSIGHVGKQEQELAQHKILAEHVSVHCNCCMQCQRRSIQVSTLTGSCFCSRDVISVPEFTLSASRCSRLHLNAVAKRVLPEHTRDALFQLFCDARTNTPKDQVFFMRHAEALKPHTFTGWLVSLVSLYATCKAIR